MRPPAPRHHATGVRSVADLGCGIGADALAFARTGLRVTAVEADPVDLIETLAQRLADVCLRDVRVEWARITVHKPDAPIEATFGDVTLTITRERPSS